MSSRPSFCAPLARLLGSCEPCRAFKWLCARDYPSPRTPSSASPRRRCSESTSARSSPPRTSPRCTQLSRRAAVAVVAARGLRAPLSADPPRSARSTRGTARAAAPHATPVESAGATERLLGPPGRVIIGPLDGAAEHGPRRPVDQDDDLRREAALRGTRRAPAGQASDTISHRSWANLPLRLGAEPGFEYVELRFTAERGFRQLRVDMDSSFYKSSYLSHGSRRLDPAAILKDCVASDVTLEWSQRVGLIPPRKRARRESDSDR